MQNYRGSTVWKLNVLSIKYCAKATKTAARKSTQALRHAHPFLSLTVVNLQAQGNTEYFFFAMITHMDRTECCKAKSTKQKEVKSDTNSNAYREVHLCNNLLEVLEKLASLYLNRVIYVYSQLFNVYFTPNLVLSILFLPAANKKLIQILVLFHNNFLSQQAQ